MVAPLLLGLGLLPELGCLVSFEGYRALENEVDASGAGGDAGSGGDGAGASLAGSGGRAPGSGGRFPGAGGVDAGVGGAGGAFLDAGPDATAAGGVTGTGGASSGGASPGGAGGGSAGGIGAGGIGSGGTSTGGSGTGGSGSGGTSAGGSGTGGAATCPVGLPGPPMLEVPSAGGGFYCIDRTEVPNDAYSVFLATTPSTSGQPPACSWNASFSPQTSSECTQLQYDPGNRPKVPISCIDWCDAKAYCEWAGKRLCGAISGGPTAPASFADADQSQWFRACSRADAREFPYGDTYQSQFCAGLDYPGTHAISVANLPNCQGGYDGIYDMSGNVAEWEDSCTASSGGGDPCIARGGSLFDADATPPTLRCNSSAPNDTTPSPALYRRDRRSEFIGVRCCYDP